MSKKGKKAAQGTGAVVLSTDLTTVTKCGHANLAGVEPHIYVSPKVWAFGILLQSSFKVEAGVALTGRPGSKPGTYFIDDYIVVKAEATSGSWKPDLDFPVLGVLHTHPAHTSVVWTSQGKQHHYSGGSSTEPCFSGIDDANVNLDFDVSLLVGNGGRFAGSVRLKTPCGGVIAVEAEVEPFFEEVLEDLTQVRKLSTTWVAAEAKTSHPGAVQANWKWCYSCGCRTRPNENGNCFVCRTPYPTTGGGNDRAAEEGMSIAYCPHCAGHTLLDEGGTCVICHKPVPTGEAAQELAAGLVGWCPTCSVHVVYDHMENCSACGTAVEPLGNDVPDDVMAMIGAALAVARLDDGAPPSADDM